MRLSMRYTVFVVSLGSMILIVRSVDAEGLQPQKGHNGTATASPLNISSGDSCVGQCAMSFIDQLGMQLGDDQTQQLLHLDFNEFLIAFSNTTFFEGFCNNYHSFQYCYTTCPHGYLQELLSRSSGIIDHFCVYNYKEVRARFGCLSKLDAQMSKQCMSTCTPYHNGVSSIMNNFKHLALNGDSTIAERYLNESCEYVICTLHCDVPTIVHMCGLETANLVIDLTRKSFASMETMALDTGAISRWPRTCNDIKTYKLPKRPDSSSDDDNSILKIPKQEPQPQVSASAQLLISLIPVVLLTVVINNL